METSGGNLQHQQPGAQNEPFFDLLQQSSASMNASPTVMTTASFPTATYQQPQKVENSSEAYFGNDDVLPSFDFQPLRAPGASSSAVGGSTSSMLRAEESRGRQGSPPKSYTTYERMRSREPPPTFETPATRSLELEKESIDAATAAAVEKTMKKYADNLLRVLEGLTGRLSQLESSAQRLEHLVEEVKIAAGDSHVEVDGKLRSLESHVLEVQRSVQLLRDRQEIFEAQSQLAKLQTASKGEPAVLHSVPSAPLPPPAPESPSHPVRDSSGKALLESSRQQPTVETPSSYYPPHAPQLPSLPAPILPQPQPLPPTQPQAQVSQAPLAPPPQLPPQQHVQQQPHLQQQVQQPQHQMQQQQSQLQVQQQLQQPMQLQQPSSMQIEVSHQQQTAPPPHPAHLSRPSIPSSPYEQQQPQQQKQPPPPPAQPMPPYGQQQQLPQQPPPPTNYGPQVTDQFSRYGAHLPQSSHPGSQHIPLPPSSYPPDLPSYHPSYGPPRPGLPPQQQSAQVPPGQQSQHSLNLGVYEPSLGRPGSAHLSVPVPNYLPPGHPGSGAAAHYEAQGLSPGSGYSGSSYRVAQPVPSAPTGGGSGYPRLPVAQPVPQARPSSAGGPGPSSSSNAPLSANRVPIDEVIEKVTAMGFSKDQVRAVVKRLTENGQSVDLNIVLDKLMNGDSSQASQKGWFGR